MTRRLASLLVIIAIAAPQGAPQSGTGLGRSDPAYRPLEDTAVTATLPGAPHHDPSSEIRDVADAGIRVGAPQPAVPLGASDQTVTLDTCPRHQRQFSRQPWASGCAETSAASTPAPTDASAVTFSGILAYASPSYGPDYLAIRQPRGTTVEICGPADCVTRVSTDFGPSPWMARQGRIADLSARDFEQVCGVPLSFGLCNGTLTLKAAPFVRRDVVPRE
jgi:hypothetical protein